MSSPFPLAAPNKLGYEQSQVDFFIEAARKQYEDPSKDIVTFYQLRNTAFDLTRGGYEITAVDAAIDRLEDAFATREIRRQKLNRGDYAIQDRLNRITEIVLGRIGRPKGKKFSRTGFVLRGYHPKQVDALCAQVERHLKSGSEIKLNAVRHALFKVKRRGYRENQVDAFIDRVVEILQLEKNR